MDSSHRASDCRDRDSADAYTDCDPANCDTGSYRYSGADAYSSTGVKADSVLHWIQGIHRQY